MKEKERTSIFRDWAVARIRSEKGRSPDLFEQAIEATNLRNSVKKYLDAGGNLEWTHTLSDGSTIIEPWDPNTKKEILDDLQD